MRFPVTLLHELGHALAARRLLGTPVSVTVGSVGRLADFELGQISVSLSALDVPTRVGGLGDVRRLPRAGL